MHFAQFSRAIQAICKAPDRQSRTQVPHIRSHQPLFGISQSILVESEDMSQESTRAKLAATHRMQSSGTPLGSTQIVLLTCSMA